MRCTVEPALPATLAALVESVTFGTEGLHYRRLDMAEQLRRFHDPVCIAAREADALVGAYVLDRRELDIAGRATNGIYRALLCVAPEASGRGVGRALVARGRAWIEETARELAAPVLSWGCIDEDNHRSSSLLASEGAREIGGLAMFMTYRQWPRERVALEPLAARRDPRERRALVTSHGDCGLRDITPSRLDGVALTDAEGIRVSARVAVSGYRIETMGTALDTIVRLGVTPFPPARRRLDPAAFRYVRLTDIALRPGCERDWAGFVSTLLAHHGTHFGMAFLDPTSALHRRLRRTGTLGPWFHSTRASVRVMARVSGGNGVDMAEATALPAGPLALAPVDG